MASLSIIGIENKIINLKSTNMSDVRLINITDTEINIKRKSLSEIISLMKFFSSLILLIKKEYFNLPELHSLNDIVRALLAC